MVYFAVVMSCKSLQPCQPSFGVKLTINIYLCVASPFAVRFSLVWLTHFTHNFNLCMFEWQQYSGCGFRSQAKSRLAVCLCLRVGVGMGVCVGEGDEGRMCGCDKILKAFWEKFCDTQEVKVTAATSWPTMLPMLH